MKYISVLLSLLTLVNVHRVSAQDWTVNPAEFEFSMSITGTVVLDDIGLINDENATLGAFVEGDCVGLCQPTEQNGDYTLFLLTVYCNNASGEMIDFKLLTAGDNEVNLETQILFHSNAIVCTAENPFVWMETAEYSSTDFLSFSHTQQTAEADINLASKEINLIVDHQVEISDFIPVFELSPGAKSYVSDVLQVSGQTSLDFTNSVTYQVVGVDGSVDDWLISVELDESAVDIEDKYNITVFPNPAKNKLTIQIPENISICDVSIYDMNNKLCLSYGGFESGDVKIPLHKLHNGLYIVRLKLNDESIIYRQIIKQ